MTERLLLRPLDPADDADAMHAYQSREDVCRYIPYCPRTREQVVERLADPERTRSTLEEAGQALSLAVERPRRPVQLVGDVVLVWTSAEHRSGEIGYVFTPDHAGQRLRRPRPCARCSRSPSTGLGLHRIIARIDARNAASAAVLRRLGMRQEAHLIENEWFKGEWTERDRLRDPRREWRARAGG